MTVLTRYRATACYGVFGILSSVRL